MQTRVDPRYLYTGMPQVGEGFKIKPALISLLGAKPFIGQAHENPHEHLAQFLKVSSTVQFRGTTEDAARIRLFPFTLTGIAEKWFRSVRNIQSWEDLAKRFLAQYFPVARVTQLKHQIMQF